jgi:hypothetical protein
MIGSAYRKMRGRRRDAQRVSSTKVQLAEWRLASPISKGVEERFGI